MFTKKIRYLRYIATRRYFQNPHHTLAKGLEFFTVLQSTLGGLYEILMEDYEKVMYILICIKDKAPAPLTPCGFISDACYGLIGSARGPPFTFFEH